MATGLFNLKQVNQAISQGAWSGYIAPKWVEYLVVAGGGGAAAGGGGGGGLLTGIVSVTAGASYTVTVGAGGASQTGNGVSGASSVFGNISTSGGGGGGWRSTALSGGSGGGSAADNSTVGGQGISGQGFAGGNNPVGYSRGAGGGGAGTRGLDSISSSVDTPGGAGIGSAISGTVVVYSAGGAGTTTAVSGASNTGNGAVGSYGSPSGAGGSGIVIVRYPGNVQFYTGGTVTYSNGYIVHNFTANGTLAPTTPTVVSEYQISRSLRFNQADSAYLNRTPASAGNRRKWTWSAWIKRGLSGDRKIFSGGTGTGSTDYLQLYFASNDSIKVSNYVADLLQTSSLYRDYSAWYHIVLVVDTDNATTTNRVQLYVNGSLAGTGNATGDLGVNQTQAHFLGYNNYSQYGDFYMTEVNFIDGQALTPTSFGYVNPSTGVWSPAKFVGGYGTNGFYLNFSDNSNTTAATLGKDYSGNSNNWTPNNFSVTAGSGNDSLVDSPTSYGTDTGVGGTVRGNYCTWNPLDKNNGSGALTNGNLDATDTNTAGTSTGVRSTLGGASGKWYFEATLTAGSNAMIGVSDLNKPLASAGWGSLNAWTYYQTTGNKYGNGTDSAYGATYTTNDVIGVAFDADAGTITFYKNGTSQGTAYTGLTGKTLSPYFGTASGTSGFTINAGQRPFAYTAPSGFKALCTQNLPTPTIGATTATQANSYFTPNLWSGNDGVQTVTNNIDTTNGGGLIWFKGRNLAISNFVVNSGSGYTKFLASNTTAAEDTFNFGFTPSTTGFSFNASSGSVNQSGYNYVAWQWKAGGAGVTNTSGSITSTVSANTTSGFSIVTFTTDGTTKTVGHGLGVKPSLIIAKVRNSVGSWIAMTDIINGSMQYGTLNTTNAFASIGYSAPTSTVFQYNDNNGNTQVAYCFAEVAGYSKFGSYTGNGSTDGPFIYTGFRPAYVMVKVTTAANVWLILDATRNTSNVVTLNLNADQSSAENTYSGWCDFTSNGFKVRGTDGAINTGSGTYIYMAFASAPFKFSLGR